MIYDKKHRLTNDRKINIYTPFHSVSTYKPENMTITKSQISHLPPNCTVSRYTKICQTLWWISGNHLNQSIAQIMPQTYYHAAVGPIYNMPSDEPTFSLHTPVSKRFSYFSLSSILALACIINI